MFRARLLLIPALLAVIMIAVCMDVEDWVHYTWNHERAEGMEKPKKPTMPYDWTLGLFHVAVYGPQCDNVTEEMYYRGSDRPRTFCKQTIFGK